MGVIARVIDHVRKATNEPSLDTMFTDSDLTGMIEQQWPVLITELNRLSSRPIIVKHAITLASGTDHYLLPPHVGEVLWLVVIDSTTNLPTAEIRPRSLWNPYGPGITLEGNMIRLAPKHLTTSLGVELWYVPNGEISLIAGTIDTFSAAGTNNTIKIKNSDITTGTQDKRENAYAGYLLSITDADGGGRVQERIVTASTVDSSGDVTCTIKPPIDTTVFTPVDGDAFEVVPYVMSKRMELALALSVAGLVLAYQEYGKRAAMIEQRRQEVMRSLRLEEVRFESRVGRHMAKDTPDNQKYGPWVAWQTW